MQTINIEKIPQTKFLYIFSIFWTLFSLALCLWSISVSSYNTSKLSHFDDCSVSNCVSTNCTIKSCVHNKCQSIYTVPGCCEDNINCTQINSTANYAFNSMCTSEINMCQPSSQNSIMSNERYVQNTLPFDEYIILNGVNNINGNVNITQLYTEFVSISNLTELFNIADRNESITFTNISASSSVNLYKFTNFAIVTAYNGIHINCTNRNGSLSLSNAIPSDFLPLHETEFVTYGTISSDSYIINLIFKTNGDLVIGYFDETSQNFLYFLNQLILDIKPFTVFFNTNS